MGVTDVSVSTAPPGKSCEEGGSGWSYAGGVCQFPHTSDHLPDHHWRGHFAKMLRGYESCIRLIYPIQQLPTAQSAATPGQAHPIAVGRGGQDVEAKDQKGYQFPSPPKKRQPGRITPRPNVQQRRQALDVFAITPSRAGKLRRRCRNPPGTRISGLIRYEEAEDYEVYRESHSADSRRVASESSNSTLISRQELNLPISWPLIPLYPLSGKRDGP